jgi:surface carbohydrate biosynthesis protein
MIRFFSSAEKDWRKVPKSDVVIYDPNGAEILAHFLHEFLVAHIRGERINLRVLAISVMRCGFFSDPVLTYSLQFLKAAEPKLIVTFIDNDINFYSISGYFPNAKTLMIQNGARDDVFDVWSKKEKFPSSPVVDFMVVFGHAYGELLSNWITGEIVIGGSAKSNSIVLSESQEDRTLLFISQISQKADEAVFGIHSDGSRVTHFDHSRAEAELLPLIQEWCATNSFRLKILARSDSVDEKNFFSEILSETKWDYCLPDIKVSCYEMVDRAELVVGINSTLLLESLGRGRKTAVFSNRGKFITNFPTVFWPKNLDEFGPFWSDEVSEFQVNRVLTFLMEIDLASWKRCCEEVVSDLIVFDSENSKIKNLISSITSMI